MLQYIPYVLVMALITYLIRALPLMLFRKEITNIYIKSFLYYVPYVTLSVMTFPAILYSTSTIWSALAALIVASLLSLKYNKQKPLKFTNEYSGKFLVIESVLCRLCPVNCVVFVFVKVESNLFVFDSGKFTLTCDISCNLDNS